MVATSKTVLVSVTVASPLTPTSEVAFDTPSEVHFTDEGEIPTCDLIFPAGMNARYKLTKKDIIRVYIGLDAIPEYPRFTGHLKQETEPMSTKMECVGSLNRAVDDKRFVDAYDNFIGLEVSSAFLKVFKEVSELSWMTCLVEKTSPAVLIPADSLYEDGVSKYDLLKQFREFAVDPTDPTKLLRYTFFQHGNTCHFRKIPLTSTTAWVQLAYGDTLLDINPEASMRFSYNKARVKGKDGVIGEFSNAHRIAIDGLAEADIQTSDDIPNASQAYEIARATVLSNMVKQLGADVLSHLLLEAIPNFTVIEITGAPYGFSDKYLVRNINIDITEGEFSISAKVNIPADILSEVMAQLVNVSGKGSSSLALQ